MIVLCSILNRQYEHSWDLSPSEAIALQKKLSAHIIIAGRPSKLTLIAGVDIAFDKSANLGFCGILIFRYPSLEIIEERFGCDHLTFPYVPGLLSFREAPLILKLFETIRNTPNCVIFDGQGIAHPRRFGVASHAGLLLGLPSIGCAKSRLFGSYNEPAMNEGSRSYIVDNEDEPIGIVLRAKENTRPVFVSPGHLVGIEEAADIVYSCADGYRIPAPTRLAHIRVGEYKRSMLKEWKD